MKIQKQGNKVVLVVSKTYIVEVKSTIEAKFRQLAETEIKQNELKLQLFADKFKKLNKLQMPLVKTTAQKQAYGKW